MTQLPVSPLKLAEQGDLMTGITCASSDRCVAIGDLDVSGPHSEGGAILVGTA
jgi:hypothetical protein